MTVRVEALVVKSLVVLVAAGSAAAAGLNPPIREVTSQASTAGGMLVPAFYRGYIYWAEPVRLFAPDGLNAYVEPPRGRAEGIAVDTDGTIAVAWSRIGDGSADGGIDLHGASGEITKTIRTGHYLPIHLAFGEDHSLWALGWQIQANAPMPERSDYAIVRKFAPSGEQVGAYLPRSRFPKGLEPGESSWQRSGAITVSRDRVGAWVNSGMSSTKTEWVEFDPDGKLTGRWRLDQFANDIRVAFTADDRVFVYFRDRDGSNPRLVMLDRETSTWRPVESPANASLVSADGDALIFADDRSGTIRLRWYLYP